MNKRVIFKEVDYSEDMEFYAHEQLEKFEPLLEEEAEQAKIDLIIEPDELQDYNRISIQVKSPSYAFDVKDRYTKDEFSVVLDRLVSSITQQIADQQQKEIEKTPAHKRITFRNMEHSAVMRDYADQQLTKLEHFLENERTPIYIDLVFEPSKLREHHRIELRVKTPLYDKISNYEYQGEKFYDVLDRVIDIMYKELHEEKQRIKRDNRKTVGRHKEFKKQR